MVRWQGDNVLTVTNSSIHIHHKMNFREQLLSELSRKNIDYIIHVVGDNDEYFDEIMRLILHDHDPVPPRAAWVGRRGSAKFPGLAEKYLSSLITALPSFTHPGTKQKRAENALTNVRAGTEAGISYRLMLPVDS